MEWTVSDAEAGSRLDAFLAERLGVSRAEARRVLERGGVRRDGRPQQGRHKGVTLAAGSRVAVERFEPPAERRATSEPALPLAILARGEGWVAVDKPPGVAVHPLREDETGTLLNALAARHPEVHGVGEGGLRSGVVHRLDVDTSGVVLFALDAERWSRLREAFGDHRVAKVYRAVVSGRIADEGHAAVDLVVARHRPARVRASDPGRGGAGARRGALRWRVVESFGGAALVEVRPREGFLHQIRATLAHCGHPVVGDRVYGGAPAGRQLLHAASLAVDDVAAESPDPPDFRAALSRLRAPL